MKRNTLMLIVYFLMASCLSQAQQWYTPGAINNFGRLEDISFINPDTGWVASAGGQIFRTDSGGSNWQLQYSGNYFIRSIGFADSLLGFAGTLDATLLKTSNGGLSWQDATEDIPINITGICGMQWLDSEAFFAVGAWFGPAYLLKTPDRGSSWIAYDVTDQAEALVDVHFMSPDTGLVCGKSSQGGVILYTIDGGIQWQEVFNTGNAGDYVWKLQIVDDQHLVASVQTFSSEGLVLISEDRGLSWTAKPVPDGNIQGIGFINSEKGWVGGYATGFYATEDGGDSWSYEPFGGNYNRFQVFDESLAYASGSQVYKYQDTTVTTSTVDIAARTFDPKLQASPNPASREVTISFELPRVNNVDLNLYSQEGTLLQPIFNGRLQSGSHRFPANLNLRAGYYLAGLQINEGVYSVPLVIQP